MTIHRNIIKVLTIIVFNISILHAVSTKNNITRASAQIPLNVFFSNPERNAPKISPDGSQIAYCAPYDNVLNIWVQTFGQNDARVITHESTRGIYSFAWTAQGKQILFLKDTNGDENDHIHCIDLETKNIRDLTPFTGVKATILAIKKDFPNNILITLNKDNPQRFDVYNLNLITGNLTLAAKNQGNIVDWLSDYQMNVRAAINQNQDGSQTLLVRDTIKDDWRELISFDFEDTLKDELYAGLLNFSRDGKKIYLNSSIDSNTRRLICIDTDTKEYSVIAQDERYDISWVFFNKETLTPDIVCWMKDRAELKILNQDIDAHIKAIRALNSGDIGMLHTSMDHQKWLIGFDSDKKSYEFYLYDTKTKHAEFLYARRPNLQEYELASMEPISFISRDGLEIHGYLTCPAHMPKKNLPLIVEVHGGPFTRDTWGYDPYAQFYANRGYACLQINFRGSSGYGKKFLGLGNREWGNTMHNDIIDGVDWAIKQGIANPQKIAISGASYGGYAALVGAAFTPDVFCCAIDLFGPTNLKTLLQSFPPYWSLAQWEKRIGKLSDEEFLKSRSPLYKVDNIKIPIFIGQGAYDVRVTQNESEQMVAALHQQGLAYEYMLFPDEGHGLARPENLIKLMTAIEKFLATNLVKN